MRSLIAALLVIAVSSFAAAADAPAGLTAPGANYKWAKIEGAGGDFGGYGWVQNGGTPLFFSAAPSSAFPRLAAMPVVQQAGQVVRSVAGMVPATFQTLGGCANGTCPTARPAFMPR